MSVVWSFDWLIDWLGYGWHIDFQTLIVLQERLGLRRFQIHRQQARPGGIYRRTLRHIRAYALVVSFMDGAGLEHWS